MPSTTLDSASGKRFHLFGYPIAHSATPAFHNACFDGLGRAHRFACWSTSAITQEMLDEIHSEAAGGAAVTMPLKAAIIEHLDELTPAAQATQACNTIVKVRRASGGRTTTTLVGTNTDVLGVRNALLRAWHAQHPGHTAAPNARFPSGAASALVIGGGATTRSAVYALHNLGLAPIYLVNRDADEVARVVESFAGAGVELVHLRSVADVDAHLSLGGAEEGKARRELAVVVGAIPSTPPATAAEHLVYELATHVFSLPRAPSPPSPSPSPLSPSENVLPLPHTPIFLDMAYKPRLTPLLRIAGARGWATVGGVQAMIEQGLAQQRMWLVGSVDDAVACGGAEILGEAVEGRVRRLVEGMEDVVVTGAEVDRAGEEGAGLPCIVILGNVDGNA